MQHKPVKYRLCYPMIKLAQGEEEAERSHVGIFSIYRAWLMNFLLPLWDKISSSPNFREKIYFSLSKIIPPRNKGFES